MLRVCCCDCDMTSQNDVTSNFESDGHQMHFMHTHAGEVILETF